MSINHSDLRTCPSHEKNFSSRSVIYFLCYCVTRAKDTTLYFITKLMRPVNFLLSLINKLIKTFWKTSKTKRESLFLATAQENPPKNRSAGLGNIVKKKNTTVSTVDFTPNGSSHEDASCFSQLLCKLVNPACNMTNFTSEKISFQSKLKHLHSVYRICLNIKA